MSEPDNNAPKRLKLIGCDIAFREVCHLAARSPNIIDVEFLPKGLHDLPTEDMRGRVQAIVDAVPADQHEAILLAYARCNDGTVGLQARSLPIVMPRAHDCITFFFGDRHRYRQYHNAHPGTYFLTSGWFERDFVQDGEQTVMRQLGLGKTREEYVAEYGEENADFIMQAIGGWVDNYSHLAYIEMGVAEELGFGERARRRAKENGWTFDHVTGDLGLLKRLVDGPWDPEDFLVLEPGQQITPRNDHYVLGIDTPESLKPPTDQ